MSEIAWTSYKNARQSVKIVLKNAEKEYVRGEVLAHKDNTISLWKIISRCIPSRSCVNRPIRYASVQNRFWRVCFNIVAFICSLLQYFIAVVCFALQPSTISVSKTNKENDNIIDFSLSKEQNLKKYSSILD
jgi:hypothetical protein